MSVELVPNPTGSLVVMGCPIRNRSWAVERHVQSMIAQTRRPDALLYLDNGSTDDTAETLLAQIPKVLAGNYDRQDEPYIQNLHVALHEPVAGGDDRVDPRYSIHNLADVRNCLIEMFLNEYPDATHLWSCDSDVIPDPDVVELLLSANKPMIAAVVRNSTALVYNFMLGVSGDGEEFFRTDREEGAITWSNGPFAAAMTGACVLIRRDVLELGCRYGYHPQGEDAAFCSNLEKTWAGPHPIYVHSEAKTAHVQKDGSEWR